MSIEALKVYVQATRLFSQSDKMDSTERFLDKGQQLMNEEIELYSSADVCVHCAGIQRQIIHAEYNFSMIMQNAAL